MNVMSIAWKIAKDAVIKFGGKVKEYFTESLRMAWSIVKSEVGAITIELSEGSKRHKSWVAEIVGLDSKYGFNRKFMNGREDENVRGLWFDLEEGKVYDVNCAQKGRKYITVKNGDAVVISHEEIKAVFSE